MIDIRECRIEDKDFITEISRLTWDGNDYLENIFEDWIKDGEFYCAVDEDRVIGTVKLSFMPEKVLWLEGLRVHPDYQGKKIGNLLNDFISKRAEELINKGIGNSIEFATYYKNFQSIKIAKNNDFEIIKRFYCLGRNPGNFIKIPTRIEPNIELFDVFDDYIPIGWKFARNTDEGRKWIKNKASFYNTDTFVFYFMEDNSELAFMPMVFSEKAFESYIPAIDFFCENMDSCELMIPDNKSSILPYLLKKGFAFWEEPFEPNVLLFRKQV